MTTLAYIRRSVAMGLVAGATTLAGCGVSTQQEVEIGQQYSAEVNRQLPIVTDATVNRYINLLGNQIARQGPRQDIAWTFYVVNTDQLNAFSLPGGFIYINRGIIDKAANVSELAGVIAHEIGHVEERHSVEQMQRMNNANLGINLAYILLGRAPSSAEQAAIQVGGSAIFARYGRQAEDEADADAVALVTRAGIDPRGLPSFFNTLLRTRERQPSAVETWFATHPTEEARIERTQALINQIPANQLTNLTRDTQAFRDFQARVRRLPAPPPQYRTQ